MFTVKIRLYNSMLGFCTIFNRPRLTIDRDIPRVQSCPEFLECWRHLVPDTDETINPFRIFVFWHYMDSSSLNKAEISRIRRLILETYWNRFPNTVDLCFCLLDSLTLFPTSIPSLCRAFVEAITLLWIWKKHCVCMKRCNRGFAMTTSANVRHRRMTWTLQEGTKGGEYNIMFIDLRWRNELKFTFM